MTIVVYPKMNLNAHTPLRCGPTQQIAKSTSLELQTAGGVQPFGCSESATIVLVLGHIGTHDLLDAS